MPTIPPQLGSPVRDREFTWESLVMQAWGSEFHAPDKGIYQFSNGAQKDSTDKGRTGLYGVSAPEVLLLDGARYPDMRDSLLLSPIPYLDNLGQSPAAGTYNQIGAEDSTPTRLNVPGDGSTLGVPSNIASPFNNGPYPGPFPVTYSVDLGPVALPVCSAGPTWSVDTMPSLNYKAVAYGNGLFVAVAAYDAGNPIVAVSLDGSVWAMSGLYNSAAGITPYNLCFGNGYFVSCVGTGYCYSQNGSSWTPNSAVTMNGTQMLSGNNQLVAVGAATGAGVWLGTSPVTNDFALKTAATTMSTGIYQGGRWLFVSNAATTTYSTSDFTAFTARGSIANNASGTVKIIGDGVSTLVAIPIGSQSTVSYSLNNGVSWQASNALPATQLVTDGMYSQGRFILTQNGRTLISADGITWAYAASEIVTGGTGGSNPWYVATTNLGVAVAVQGGAAKVTVGSRGVC